MSAYADSVSTLDADALVRERAALASSPAGGAGGEHAARLAVLFSHPRAPFRDASRARALLARRLGDDDALAALALRVLHAGTHRDAEHRAAAAALAQARDEGEALRARVRTLERELAAEREERRRLERQLEELKAIERSIGSETQ